ncbi:manganese efflux pump MntP family protein [Mesobacillus zeae]|uniref:Putative manganese efflux pump MntP n=1 Tax=Mesobacillus zeae TaxID=1917180 RepID=A0A398BAN9_9BACI|nr:manganese efflux pump MntP family protein [Mesobacillus zeae]RID86892.1 manganese efflux pump [Mesobacillus zeae]
MAATVGELITLLLMAFALSMDAFSVGLSMGMLSLTKRQIFKIGLTIGIFHVLMPLLGIAVGSFLSHQFGAIAGYIGGTLLVLMGIQMIRSGFEQDGGSMMAPIGKGLFLFAFSVSLDSFSVGLTLGIYGARTLVVLVCFGAASAILAWAGLLIGRKVQGILGSYGEVLGGTILLVLGIKLLLPI